MASREITTLREVVTKLTQLLAGRDLVVTQQGVQAYVRYNKRSGRPELVNIPNIADDASDDLILAIHGFIDHEIGHILHTDYKVMAKAGAAGDKAMGTWNIVEDTYIERAMGQQFKGSVSNLNRLHKFFVEKITTPALKALKPGESAIKYLMVPICRAWAGQDVFQNYLDDNKYWDLPDVKEFCDRIPQALKDKFRTIKSSAEAFEVSQAIVKAYEKPKPPAEPKVKEPKEPKPKEPKKPEEKKEEPESEAPPSDEASESVAGEDDNESDDAEPEAGATGAAADDEEEADEGEGGSDDDEEGEGGSEEPKLEDFSTEDEKPAPDPEDGEEGSDGSDGESADKADKEEEGTVGEAVEASGDDPDDGDESGGDADGESASDAGASDRDDKEKTGGERPESGDYEAPEEEAEPEPSAEEPPPEMPTAEDFAAAIGEKISEDASKEISASDYRVFTRDYDKIEAYEVSEGFNDRLLTDLEDKTRTMVGVMQKDVERMMAARSQVLNVGGFHSGKLHSAGLHRMATGDTRVFRRKVESNSKDTAVSLLVDNSGSMSGMNKIEVAMTAAYALSQTLERAKISHEVIGFTTKYMVTPGLDAAEEELDFQFSRSEPLYMPIFKDWHERLTPPVKKRFAEAAVNSGFLANNVDGECVEIAYNRLMQRPEKRKILMVLSDGSPYAAGDRHAQARKLKSVVKKIHDDKRAYILGIGIMDSSVTAYYPNRVVLKDINALPGTIMGEVKKLLLA